jgi:TolB-like protein
LTQFLSATLVIGGEMRVISTTSAARYQAAAVSADGAADLPARYVIDGAVTIADGRARVTVALTDRASDIIRWAQNFEGSTTDALTLEREIGEAVTVEVVRIIKESTASTRAALVVRR